MIHSAIKYSISLNDASGHSLSDDPYLDDLINVTGIMR